MVLYYILAFILSLLLQLCFYDCQLGDGTFTVQFLFYVFHVLHQIMCTIKSVFVLPSSANNKNNKTAGGIQQTKDMAIIFQEPDYAINSIIEPTTIL